MSKPQKFIVWSPQGPTPPRKQYSCYESAKREAMKMAELFKGQDFFVMKAVISAKVQEPVLITEYDQDEIPF